MTKAVGIILSNDPEHTRNLFDVIYGAKKPATPGKELHGICTICALCVDTGTGQPCNPGDTPANHKQTWWIWPSGSNGENNPRLYRAGTEPPWWISPWKRVASQNNMTLDGGMLPPGFEIRDMLHMAGISPAAQRAHYQAMPLLSEMSALLGQPSIRDVFGAQFSAINSAELLWTTSAVPSNQDTVTTLTR